MPIRFSCPSCRQPIEIDDQWAGQSVACPYCNRVVTAPATSTWSPESQIPQAAPAARPFQPSPPPPPGGFSHPPTPTTMSGDATGKRSTSAAWALALTLAGAGFIIVAFMSFGLAFATTMVDTLGQPPTNRQAPEYVAYQKKVFDLMQSGTVKPPQTSVIAILMGLACSIGGAIFSIRTAIGRERRGLGIGLSVFAFLCLVCQGFFSMAMVGITMSSRLPQ